MTQFAANILKRIHLVIIGAPTGNQRVAQGAVAICHFGENGRLFGANAVAQIVGDALHARAIILETLAGLTAGRLR
jgi:hypothetical protein